jgi:nucleoside-diphosphate-sugar epimerase
LNRRQDFVTSVAQSTCLLLTAIARSVKRVIVTGATGFVGANLTRRLLHDGHDVDLFVRSGYASWRIDEIHTEVRIHTVDFADQVELDRVVSMVRPEWVFHLAAYGAYSSQYDLGLMAQTNIIGTMNLVEACLRTGFEAFVNTGSSSEYGYKDYAPAETEWLEPNSHYAVTKAAATLFCRYTAQSEGVHLPTLRLYSVYGPYEEPTRLMPSLAVRGLEGRLPPLVNPATARDYVFVDDVSDAFVRVASTPVHERGPVYNIGTGTQTTLSDLVSIVRRVMEIDADPDWGSMPNRAWDTAYWVADSRKVRDALGWEPRYDLERGFRRMVDWFKDNPALLAFYRSQQANVT